MNYIRNFIKYITKTVTDIVVPENEKLDRILSSNNIINTLPRSKDIEDRNTYPVFNYKNKDVKTLIWALKYKANREVVKKLAPIIYEELLTLSEEEMPIRGKNSIGLIPVPMSRERFREKNFNQCELLCEEICKINPSQIKTYNVLEKIKDTSHQTNLHRKERLENMKNSMRLLPDTSSKIPLDTLIVIIDDVYTTGATINEARRALGDNTTLAVTVAH